MIGVDYTDPHMSPDDPPCCPLCGQELADMGDYLYCPEDYCDFEYIKADHDQRAWL